MRNRTFLLPLILASFFFSPSYSQVEQSWAQIYATDARDIPVAIKTNGNGSSIYVLGGPGITLIKYNTLGEVQWVQNYPGVGVGPNELALDAAGNIYVTGGSPSDKKFVTIKYDASGAQQWIATYLRPDAFFISCFATAVDASGNVYVTGTINYNGAFAAQDYLTIKYNSAGVEQWAKTFNGTANDTDIGLFISVDPSGNIYVTGESTGQRNKGGVFGPFSSSKINISSHLDFVSVKYDPNGNQLLTDSYIGAGDDVPTGQAVDGSGNLYVTGRSANTPLPDDISTVKFNSSGARQWLAQFKGDAEDFSTGVAVDASGNVYVAGATQTVANQNSSYDALLIKYDASGVEQWRKTYNGPANDVDRFNSIGIGFDGAIFVTGESKGVGTDNDFVTVMYSSSGVQVWAARYNGPSNSSDASKAIAVFQPTGPEVITATIYVTGPINGSGGEDFGTIKYIQPIVSTEAADPRLLKKPAVYPNPFTTTTNIQFTAAENGKALVELYNISGRKMRTLFSGIVVQGQEYNVPIGDAEMTQGIYVYMIRNGRLRQTGRIIKLD